MIAHVLVPLPTCPHCGAEDLKSDAPDGGGAVRINCYCCAKDYSLRKESGLSRSWNYTTSK